MSLRYPIAFVLSLVCLAAPAWADYRAGEDAYYRGDYTTAFRELMPLAESGYAFSEYFLGLMYVKGEGVPRDSKEAVRWYRLAAEQGEARDQGNLGLMYAKGEGVLQDYVLAHMWFNLAAAQGEKVATDLRDSLAKKMTPAQIAEAQKLAAEWKPRDK